MRGLLKDRRGNIAVMTALLAPLMLAFAGGGVDFYRWSNQRAELKELADMLATRGAREFLLANATASQIRSVLKSAVDHGAADNFDLGAFVMDVGVDMTNAAVSVTLVQPPKPGLLLTKVSPYKEDISIRSTAVARGGMNVCVVALEESASGAVSAQLNAKLTARECAIMSNSTSTLGVVASGGAKLTAASICSAGGYGGIFMNYEPTPTTDCPAYPDPLADRPAPSVGSCTYNDKSVGKASKIIEKAVARTADNLVASSALRLPDRLLNKDGAIAETLSPGVYCGGLTVGSAGDATLLPGLYVIKDGPLAVALGGRLSGEGVSFYLVGDDATLFFGPESKITLTAQEDGPLAGILFFEDRNAPAERLHKILSDDARTLLGTFYLPRGILAVASVLPVADQSAYTVIVAKKLVMVGSPTLVLNADYDSTNVPVPDGVGPMGGTIYLRE